MRPRIRVSCSSSKIPLVRVAGPARGGRDDMDAERPAIMQLHEFKAHCTKNGCPKFGVPVTIRLDPAKKPRCGVCAQLLTIDREKDVAEKTGPNTPYDKTKRRVLEAIDAGSDLGKYCAKVLAFLDTHHKFRHDFITELDKPIDLGKFTKNSGETKRATDNKSSCTDFAFEYVGVALPPGCPKGEKFSFETPYIMETAGWTYLDYCRNRPLLNAPFSMFRVNAAKEAVWRKYLVVWALEAGKTESHMFAVIVEPNGKAAWLYDPQQQAANYTKGFCEVWMNPEAGGSKPDDSYCALDLGTGEKGEWVGRRRK
jgi:hypothetical protein